MLDVIFDRDTAIVNEAIAARTAYLPPVVLTEALSRPQLSDNARNVILRLPLLQIRDGFWRRAGLLRAALGTRDLKAKLADCLIAQCCIDEDIPLITHDTDFRHFVAAGLTLL